jgi:primosomal protein N' (replication factor Y)
LYIDVILPLPLNGLFTYSVPTEHQQRVKIGCRVSVPFGRSKTYVGIIAKTHTGALPEGFSIKDIIQVLDQSPILLDNQLRLWKWISEYYMSTIGDVYKAALPSGLKAEDGYKPKTETYIRLTPNFSNERAIHVAVDMLQRAAKQQAAFIDFLSISGWADGTPMRLLATNSLTKGILCRLYLRFRSVDYWRCMKKKSDG